MYKWLISMSLLCAVANGQSAYTWVDENGQTHYSDRPFPGASEVELATAQGFSAPQPPAIPLSEASDDSSPADAYTAFNILQPGNQETLWNIAGNVEVALEIAPRLQLGHHLGVYLDGTLTDLGTNAPQFQLTDVVRGQHSIQAVILDRTGEPILRSLAVPFMVQQTSIQNPNNPNAPNRPVNPIVPPRNPNVP